MYSSTYKPLSEPAASGVETWQKEEIGDIHTIIDSRREACVLSNLQTTRPSVLFAAYLRRQKNVCSRIEPNPVYYFMSNTFSVITFPLFKP
jgi:hypothetical protein